MDRGGCRRADGAADDDAWTTQALNVLGVFGLTTDDLATDRAERLSRAHATVGAILEAMPRRASCIALITGPSGGGKSTALRLVIDRAERDGQRVVVSDRSLSSADMRRRVVALFGGRAGHADDLRLILRTLSAAGLADARLAARRVGELSDGERARLRLAIAMHQAETIAGESERPVLVAIDEFCTGLDDATTMGVCATLERWARMRTVHRVPIHMLCASARDSVPLHLACDVHAVIDLSGRGTVQVRPSRTSGLGLVITRGVAGDYAAMADLHYRAHRPATIVRVLVARAEGSDTPIGVLTVSMPTLNGAWRARAWPDLVPKSHSRSDLRAAARRLNDPRPNGSGVRCISRVIVDPRFRGQGIAASLVRAYLSDPLTPRTEAVAAMGAACPLFERAGMREWILTHTQRDQALLAVLSTRGLVSADLVHVDHAERVIKRDPAMTAALVRWARASRATRLIADADLRTLIRAAAKTLSVPPRAYTSR